MRRSLVFAALVFCASLASCQCAEQPDVGPVEGEAGGEQSTTAVGTPTPPVP